MDVDVQSLMQSLLVTFCRIFCKKHKQSVNLVMRLVSQGFPKVQSQVTTHQNALHIHNVCLHDGARQHGVCMQVKRSLDWLRGESQGNRRYAAVLILREMAENAPAVFNVHVRSFIEIIWAGLRDAKVIVREASVAALRVFLPSAPLRSSPFAFQSCLLLLLLCQSSLFQYQHET